ncbi:transcription and mRNA export factor ENY2-like [Synchiropus picturatus]
MDERERGKLVECGWKDELKAHCKDVKREKGREHVTVQCLVSEITPIGRGMQLRLFVYLFRLILTGFSSKNIFFLLCAALVPDSVKKELLQRIRAFLAQHATL